MPERFDPQQLVAWYDDRTGNATLRSVARRLQIDPAVLCRPLSARQADRYATALGAHPGEIWARWYDPTAPEIDHAAAAHQEQEANDAERRRRQIAAAAERAAAMSSVHRRSAYTQLHAQPRGSVGELRKALGVTVQEAASAIGCSTNEIAILDSQFRGDKHRRMTPTFIDYAAFLVALRDGAGLAVRIHRQARTVGTSAGLGDETTDDDPWEMLG